MAEAAEAVALAPPAAEAPVAPRCEFCDEPAVYGYTYAWGASGTVCAKHAINVQQTAKNTKSHVQLVALSAGKPAPITRDERTRLLSEKISAELERDDANMRNAELHNQVRDLAAQLQREKLLNREAMVQLKASQADAQELTAELARRETQLADAGEELGRLRVLAEERIASLDEKPFVVELDPAVP